MRVCAGATDALATLDRQGWREHLTHQHKHVPCVLLVSGAFDLPVPLMLLAHPPYRLPSYITLRAGLPGCCLLRVHASATDAPATLAYQGGNAHLSRQHQHAQCVSPSG